MALGEKDFEPTGQWNLIPNPISGTGEVKPEGKQVLLGKWIRMLKPFTQKYSTEQRQLNVEQSSGLELRWHRSSAWDAVSLLSPSGPETRACKFSPLLELQRKSASASPGSQLKMQIPRPHSSWRRLQVILQLAQV